MCELKWYKADLHIHSVLSPCGDLSMSPSVVIEKLLEKKVDMFAITDHNSMANFQAYKAQADKFNIKCFPGIEVQTSEEVHIIALFDDYEKAKKFDRQCYLSLLPLENDPDFFGDQVLIDENENLLGFENRALINSSVWSLEETVEKIRIFDGFCFPAHEDAMSYSITAQLGFIPEVLDFPAIGITAKCDKENLFTKFPYFLKYALLRNSDAHYPQDIALGTTEFFIKDRSVKEIELATKGLNGRLLKS